MFDHATIIVDGHVHIYSHYNLNDAIKIGINNLKSTIKEKTDSDVIPVWLLVERHDCSFFNEATDSAPINFENSGYTLNTSDEKETLIIEKDGTPILFILAGRQIVTQEGLEVMSLASTLFIEDRTKSTAQVIEHINKNGGVALINWAPAKWFFSRGKVVDKMLDIFSPDELLIGDTSLRTTMWQLPKLMSKAIKKGFKIIAGSDPLPFENEEKLIGTYCFQLTGKFDEKQPAASIRQLLKSSASDISIKGKRNGLIKFLKRQIRIMLVKS